MVVYSSPKTRKRPLRLLVILLVLVAIGYGIYRLFSGGEQKAPTPPPAAVTVQTVERRDIPLVFDYPARLAGSREVEVRARVNGILLKRNYTEGQFVKRGDLLFQIDPEPYQAALAEAQANASRTERDYRRAQTLSKQKALSAREFDEAKGAYAAAAAQLQAARLNLDYTNVRAPISGYTSEESNSEGTLVAANTTLLTRLMQLDPIYIEFAYSDSEAMLQRRGVTNGSIRLPASKLLDVELVFNDKTTYPQLAHIRFTDSFISPDTGTVHARAVVPNKDQSLMPGQFVRARVKGMTQVDAIGIPERALMQGPMGMFVYTVNAEGKAQITPVEIGLLNNGTQIITKGLESGAQLVTEGMIKVKPDSPVCIDTEEAPCNKPAPKKEDAPAAPAPAPAAEKKDAPTATAKE